MAIVSGYCGYYITFYNTAIGYPSWFVSLDLNIILQMMKNISKEQADRIFRSLDTKGDNRVSLEEFRAMLDRGKDLKNKSSAAAAPTEASGSTSRAAAI